MSGPVDVGRPPPSMLASTLRRGRGAVTVCPGVLGLAEVLLCEDEPAHRDADWTALTTRRGGDR
jgi:hypothetical protein